MQASLPSSAFIANKRSLVAAAVWHADPQKPHLHIPQKNLSLTQSVELSGVVGRIGGDISQIIPPISRLPVEIC